MTKCVISRCRGDDEPREAQPGTCACQPCTTRVRNQCAALPNLANWLQLHIAAGRGTGLEPVSGSREAPTPLRLDVLAVTGRAARFTVHDGIDPVTGKPYRDQFPIPNIQNVLSGWVRVTGEQIGLDDEDDEKWPADTIEAMAEWLSSRIGWICRQEWVAEMAAEIAELHDAGKELAPIHIGRIHLRKPCPSVSCDRMTLVLEYVPDETHPSAKKASAHEYPRVICDVRAGGCNRVWRQDEYDWLGHVLSGGAA